jgi:hypothetical protein
MMMEALGISVQPGQLVAGRYRIEEAVGRGGFGAVFRATEVKLDRSVALKILLPSVVTSPQAVERFRREVKLAQKLEHPNTVRLYDFGETEQGLPFISWEFLRGRSLEEVLAREGAMDAARVSRIGRQVLKSLMEAHGRGIVHRDIKPANVLLCDFAGEPDFVKVLDFGVAKVAARDGEGTLTQDGHAVGTPSYMAPEQVLGEQVDARSDLYAVGLTLAEMLSGRRIYEGDSAMKLCIAQASQNPVPLPVEVTRSAIGPAIVRATHKLPTQRYASAAEMLAALEQMAAGLSATVAASSVQTAASHAEAMLGTAPTIGAMADANIGHAATVATPQPALSSGSQPVPPAVVGHTGQPLVVTSGPSLGKIALLMAAMLFAFAGVAGSLFYFGVIPSPGVRPGAPPGVDEDAENGIESDAGVEKGAPSASVTLPTGPPLEHVKAPPSLDRFTVRGKSAQAMLDALADDGWTVNLQPERADHVIKVVVALIMHDRTNVGTIQFHTHGSTSDAAMSVAVLRGQAAVVHDGPHVVYLNVRAGADPGLPLANALLDRLLK